MRLSKKHMEIFLVHGIIECTCTLTGQTPELPKTASPNRTPASPNRTPESPNRTPESPNRTAASLNRTAASVIAPHPVDLEKYKCI